MKSEKHENRTKLNTVNILQQWKLLRKLQKELKQKLN